LEVSRSAHRPEPAPQVIAPVCEALVPQSAPLDDGLPVRAAETSREVETRAPVAVAAPQAPADEAVPHSTAQELRRSAPQVTLGVVGRMDSELKFAVSGNDPEPAPAAEEVEDTSEATVESAAEVVEVERGRSDSRTNVSVEVEAAPANVVPAPAIEVHAPSVREPGRGEVASHEAARAEIASEDQPVGGASKLAPLRINLTEQQAPDEVTLKFAASEESTPAEKPAAPVRVAAKKPRIAPIVITPIEAVRPKVARQQSRASEAPANSADKRELVHRTPVKRDTTPIEAAPATTVKTEPTLARSPVAEHVPVAEVAAAQPEQGQPTPANPALEKRHVAEQEPTPTPAEVVAAPVVAAPVVAEPVVTAPLVTSSIVAAPTLTKPEPAAPAVPAPTVAQIVPQELRPAKVEAAPAESAPRVAQQPAVAGVESSRSESTKYGNPKGDVAHQDALKRPVASPREMLEVSVSPQSLAGRESAAERSARLIADVSRADHRVANGFQLAHRGAIYLAKSEFTAALKLIAQANDIEHGTRVHGKAVTAGLVALKESGDFVRQMAGIDDIDLARIVSAHKTPVLKGVDVTEMAPTVAAQYYYAFAQNELASAISGEMVGSMAMYGLGKATLVAAGANAHQMEYTGQAMAYYQAAMAVEPRNVRAANELGVLLANNGQLKQARDMLTRSVSIAPNATTWQNLAVVHNRMGDHKTAEQLKHQASQMKQAGNNPAVPAVQWVDPATFAGITPATDGTAQQPASAIATRTTPSAKPATEPAHPPASVAQRINEWLPQSLRR
jgi:tetratricopeptide (TPR) repeat protein